MWPPFHLIGFSLLLIVLCPHRGAASAHAPVFEVPASAETQAVRQGGDAADDVAIWRNAAAPAQSRIFATDKKTGLLVFDLAGSIVASFDVGRLNNVDLRANWPGGGGKTVLVSASNRSRRGISFFLLDPTSLAVSHLASSFLSADLDEPYGHCLYRSVSDGRLYAFLVGKDGAVRQFLLNAAPGGEVSGSLVRSFALETIAEGCVSDDRTGQLYIAEENRGIWRYPAEPDGQAERMLVSAIDGKDIVADIEGLALAPSGEKAGYLVASIQGNSSFAMISLADGTLAARFRISAGRGIDEVTGSDGLELALGDFGPDYPQGLLVVQDDENADGAAQNFKLVSWRAVLERGGMTADPVGAKRGK
jgi:3-phytase